MTTINEPTESVYDQALAQREAGDIHGAIRTLTAAARESLTDVTLVVTLGQMLTETEQPKRAGRWLRHAMKLAPDDLYARMAYRIFLGKTGQLSEARVLLDGVRQDIRRMLASPDAEVRESVDDAQGFLACTEVNMARAALESGNSALARDLAGPWLTDPVYWPGARNVLAEVLEKDGLDPVRLAEEGLAAGQVSPFMVCHLLEARRADVGHVRLPDHAPAPPHPPGTKTHP